MIEFVRADSVIWLTLTLLALAAVLSFIRLVKGPSLPDRVVAMDMLSVIGVGVMLVYAVLKDQPLFIDVALVLALISFLGTIAFAYYIDQRA